MTDGEKVNAILRKLYDVQPKSRDRQLTLLAIALVVACRGCGCSRAETLGGLAEAWDEAADIQLVPLEVMQ